MARSRASSWVASQNSTSGVWGDGPQRLDRDGQHQGRIGGDRARREMSGEDALGTRQRAGLGVPDAQAGDDLVDRPLHEDVDVEDPFAAAQQDAARRPRAEQCVGEDGRRREPGEVGAAAAVVTALDQPRLPDHVFPAYPRSPAARGARAALRQRCLPHRLPPFVRLRLVLTVQNRGPLAYVTWVTAAVAHAPGAAHYSDRVRPCTSSR